MTIHLQTGSSTVRCGAPMRTSPDIDGWDLGDVTVDPTKVTCSGCGGRANWTPSPAEFSALCAPSDAILEGIRAEVSSGGYEESVEVLFALATQAVQAYVAAGADSLPGTLQAISENLEVIFPLSFADPRFAGRRS